MNMEGESRKRKMVEEEDEEEKMEEFFALIRRTQEARHRMMRGLPEVEKKKGEDEKAVEGWNPAFRPEDFMGGSGGGYQSKVHQASLGIAGPSGREDESKEEGKETRDADKGRGGADGLDLKLSL